MRGPEAQKRALVREINEHLNGVQGPPNPDPEALEVIRRMRELRAEIRSKNRKIREMNDIPSASGERDAHIGAVDVLGMTMLARIMRG